MLKKSIVVGLGLLLLSGLFFGRDAASYVSTSMGWMHDSVRDSVPVTFELERARKMIRDLDPEIRRNMRLIAVEESEVDKLRSQVEHVQTDLAKSQDQIMRLNDDLKSGNKNLEYAGRVYTSTQVKTDLERRFERHKTKEATADKLEKILTARERGLLAARDKLEAMLAAKRQLEVDVENLEARQKMVEVAQTTSDFNFDDSHLARTKELIADIQTRIDVAEKMVNAEGVYHDEIPLDAPAEGEDISLQITKYFSGDDYGIQLDTLADSTR